MPYEKPAHLMDPPEETADETADETPDETPDDVGPTCRNCDAPVDSEDEIFCTEECEREFSEGSAVQYDTERERDDDL